MLEQPPGWEVSARPLFKACWVRASPLPPTRHPSADDWDGAALAEDWAPLRGMPHLTSLVLSSVEALQDDMPHLLALTQVCLHGSHGILAAPFLEAAPAAALFSSAPPRIQPQPSPPPPPSRLPPAGAGAVAALLLLLLPSPQPADQPDISGPSGEL